MAKVVIIAGPGKDLIYELDQEAILGRLSSNEIPLQDNKASRQHSRIFLQQGSYFVEDLKSRNGTLLNGKITNKHKLVSGDRIKIGQTILLFSEEDDSGATADISDLVEEEKEEKPVASAPKPEVKSPPLLQNISVKKSGTRISKVKSRHKKNSLLAMDFGQYSPSQKMTCIVAVLIFMALLAMASRWLTLIFIN